MDHPRISQDTKVMVGKPVIRGTRITVELILRKLSDGSSEEMILDGYLPICSARTSMPHWLLPLTFSER